SSNEEEFNNGETELSEEEAECQLPYYSGGSKHTQQCKNKELQEAAQGSMSLDNFFKSVKKLEVKYEMSDSDINDSNIENNKSHSYVKLSLKISQQVFQCDPWMARHICEWSKSWITTETLPVSKQEQRKYIPTLIDDEDVQSSCLHFICTMGERITVEEFQNYVQNNVLPHVSSSRTSISLETARTWLRHLGLVYQ
ncbi:8578_t:CDS:2, partial [Cetraspora pellucida]